MALYLLSRSHMTLIEIGPGVLNNVGHNDMLLFVFTVSSQQSDVQCRSRAVGSRTHR